MILFWIVTIAMFPGYMNDGSPDKFYNWFYNIELKIIIATSALWLTITFSSSAITIYAISKIFKAIKEL